MNKFYAILLILAVTLPMAATLSKSGIGNERDERVVRLYNDCPPEKQDEQGRCPRSHRNGYHSGGHRSGK